MIFEKSILEENHLIGLNGDRRRTCATGPCVRLPFLCLSLRVGVSEFVSACEWPRVCVSLFLFLFYSVLNRIECIGISLKVPSLFPLMATSATMFRTIFLATKWFSFPPGWSSSLPSLSLAKGRDWGQSNPDLLARSHFGNSVFFGRKMYARIDCL